MFRSFPTHLIVCACTGVILISMAGCGSSGPASVPPNPAKAQEAQTKAMEDAKAHMQKEIEKHRPGGAPGN